MLNYSILKMKNKAKKKTFDFDNNHKRGKCNHNKMKRTHLDYLRLKEFGTN